MSPSIGGIDAAGGALSIANGPNGALGHHALCHAVLARGSAIEQQRVPIGVVLDVLGHGRSSKLALQTIVRSLVNGTIGALGEHVQGPVVVALRLESVARCHTLKWMEVQLVPTRTL
jgi:hypothetical protein